MAAVGRDEACDFRDDEAAIQVALFRYGVLAPLVEREGLSRGEVHPLVVEIAARTHYLPGRGPVRVHERTVYAWLRRWRRGGVDALRPRRRRDRGTHRALDEALLERAVQLRQEVPARHTKTVLDILRLEGRLGAKPPPHRATLDRHLARRGASRRQLRVLGERRTVRLHFAHFGDLWVGDYHHGPLVRRPDGQPTAAKLGAFLDHATRWPVADRWYLAEDLVSLRDTLLRALLTWGAPRKVYVDRGAVYRAEQLAYSLLHIDTKLVHSRAYYSQGRGVIERWWQLAEAFEAEVGARPELLTLPELNRLWEAWRELRYCREVHSALGKTPHEAIASVEPRPLDVRVARELFLVQARRQVHKKDGCVSVEGRRFLCESFLRGQFVQVRYDPGDLASVLVFHDGKRIQRAFPQPLGATPEPHPEPVHPAQRAAPSVDYLALLREDFDQRLLEHARPLAYTALRPDPAFDGVRFAEVVAQLAGLALRPAERRELAAFWDSYGPLPEALVRIATEHAVRLHARGRHPRIYLHAIRTLVLAHWTSPQREE
jgi:transposase InsO family protein